MKNLLLTFLTILTFLACNKEDDGIAFQSLLANASIETGSGDSPIGWWSNSGPNSLEWSSEQAFLGSRSIAMTSTANNSNFSFWAQTLNENLVHDKLMRLSTQVKLENIVGEGISLVIRGDDTIAPEGPAEYFYNSDNTITGTQDWQNYSVTTDMVIPKAIQSITIYLILLPNTTGKVYFDAIELAYL